MRQYITEVRDETGSHPVPASKKAIAAALQTQQLRLAAEAKVRKLQHQLDTIQQQCKHVVCYDEPGLSYSSRICVACNHVSLL